MDKAKRKAIIAGNWKMNKTASEAAVLVDELVPAVQDAGCEVVICTPYTDLVTAVEKTKGTNIRQRQAEGIAAAKSKGVRFGRPPSPLPENFHSAYQKWRSGKMTGTDAAKACGMPLSTFRYRAKIYEKTTFL